MLWPKFLVSASCLVKITGFAAELTHQLALQLSSAVEAGLKCICDTQLHQNPSECFVVQKALAWLSRSIELCVGADIWCSANAILADILNLKRQTSFPGALLQTWGKKLH